MPSLAPTARPTALPTPTPTHCPSGEIVLGGRCTPCESGRYASNITWSCELCEAGRFQTFPGRASCDRCNPGELSTLNRVYCAPERPTWINFNPRTNLELTHFSWIQKHSYTFVSKWEPARAIAQITAQTIAQTIVLQC